MVTTAKQNKNTYLTNIKDTFVSIFKGMSVTLSYLFRRPYTIQYPDRIEKDIRDYIPEGSRGLLEVDIDICTGCKACMRACPLGVINIVVEKWGDEKKDRYILLFDIDNSKCMFCGLCSEPCPTGAIMHTKEFQYAVTDQDKLVFQFIKYGEPKKVYKPKKGVDPERKPLGSILREHFLTDYSPQLASINMVYPHRRGHLQTDKSGWPSFSDPATCPEELIAKKEVRKEKSLIQKPREDSSKIKELSIEDFKEMLKSKLAGTDCGACGYDDCEGYAKALTTGEEKDLTLCEPGGDETKISIESLIKARFAGDNVSETKQKKTEVAEEVAGDEDRFMGVGPDGRVSKDTDFLFSIHPTEL